MLLRIHTLQFAASRNLLHGLNYIMKQLPNRSLQIFHSEGSTKIGLSNIITQDLLHLAVHGPNTTRGFKLADNSS